MKKSRYVIINLKVPEVTKVLIFENNQTTNIYWRRIKKIDSNPCTIYQKLLKVLFDFSFPVECTCKHEFCVKSVIKKLPEEEVELCCQACKSA